MSLTIDSLSKKYTNGVIALHDLSLSIDKGMFGLLGPNGAGKSTLMRTLATLQFPDSGAIQFNDIDVLNQPMELRKILGYLPQDFGVYKGERAEDLLNYMAILKGVSSKKDRERLIDRVLELTNLNDVRKNHVSSYSGGMKQRFGIAQLLLNDPKLIIVDEPTSGLDPAERNRFLNILREIGTEHTVIFSTHFVEDIKDLCTDMAILDKGSVRLHETPTRACNRLEGSIWTTDLEKDEVEHTKEQFNVLSQSYNPDNTVNIRVYSDDRPNEDFRPIEAGLEDVYFSILLRTSVVNFPAV